MEINRKITPYNKTVKSSTERIKYIVIHYVGAVSSAKANADYFYTAKRGASAHYFTDEREVWQIVDDKDAAWHCGTKGKYRHPKCRNSNSLGIEMCVKKNSLGQWYFEEKTVKRTVDLVRGLMEKYSVPKENILRHFDVTGKLCPEPYVREPLAWQEFLNMLTDTDKGFSTGKYLVTADMLNVRIAAGVKNHAKKFAELTENARAQIFAKNGKEADGYVAGMVCDVSEISGDWGHTPSGWINLRYCKILAKEDEK